MREVFVGSQAIRSGRVTPGQLRWNYTAIYPDVYVAKGRRPSLRVRTIGAALWANRGGVIAGRAAAALHGARWVDPMTPIELIAGYSRSPAGIIVRNERLQDDEIVQVCGLAVTNPARTALDLARHLPRDDAVAHLDALARATGVRAQDALALRDRYPKARGLFSAAKVLPLLDPGGHSPRETWLRLVLIDGGLPRPRTQIRLSDGFTEAFIDLGYDDAKLGLDYEGAQHAMDRRQYVHDIGRAEFIDRQGWLDIRVVAEHSRAFILHRVRTALKLRSRS